jgi:hypothetical protein
MNIEYKFLQKAINDKNYVSFSYKNKSYKNIKPLKLDNENRLYSDKGVFEFGKIKKLMILREKF